MAHAVKIALCILWVITLYITGALLFAKGFLLTRFVLDHNNTCNANFTVQTDSHGHQGCWMHSRYKRTVLIIIDALRFDFVAFNESVSPEKELPYQNKLKTIHELLMDKPQHSRLYHYIADPPTTTLQRLKGITTGSLPTFIDIASNFDSAVISEDNFIRQLRIQEKSIVFMGDDTWLSLFPTEFKRSFDYPSFNVKDLHTVDNGVISHLEPELQKQDWDFLIAHFLGVDHCGHRYGPNHPAMAEKLTQMDETLKSVVKQLDDDTILFVLGDHGMTRTGDHGGDSWDELHAALFVYSPSQLTTSQMRKDVFPTISQIDLVPTLSLLLGSPIPFPNLGTIIPDLFNYCPWWKTEANIIKQEYHIIKALRLNAHQVRNYIQTYADHSDEFPTGFVPKMERKFTQIELYLQDIVTRLHIHGDDENLLENLQQTRKSYSEYLTEIKQMCRDIWAKFDLTNMVLGITLIACGIVLTLLWIIPLVEPNNDHIVGFTGSCFMFLLIGFLAASKVTLIHTMYGLCLGFAFIGFLLFVGLKTNLFLFHVRDLLHVDNIYPLSVTAAYFASLFSNSFVVHEDSVTSFFLQSLIIYSVYKVINNLYHSQKEKQIHGRKQTKVVQFDIGRVITSPMSLILAIGFVGCVCITLSANFRNCREEQWTCEPPAFLQSLSALPDQARHYKNFRYFFSVGTVSIFSLLITMWMRHCGNLNGQEPSVMCVKYLLPTSTIALCLYWALQTLPSQIFDNLPFWQITLFPRILYACVLVTFICVLVRPLSLFVVMRSSESPVPVLSTSSNEVVLNRLYNHLKSNWRKHLCSTSSGVENSMPTDKSSQPPMVYGLGTVYSSSLITLLTAVTVLMFMLLGDGLAPSLVLEVGTMFIILEIHAASKTVLNDKTYTVPWRVILTWGILASEHFYSTGHQTVITTIQWQSAFHGFHGDFDNYIIPIFMVLTNTLASYIFSVIALPLLILWPLVRGELMFKFTRQKDKKSNQVETRGEFVLHEDDESFKIALKRLFMSYILFHAIKLFGTMCCAFIHRRHLMVWKIFAPRFLFEAVTFLVSAPLCLLVYLFMLRINMALENWVEKLKKNS